MTSARGTFVGLAAGAALLLALAGCGQTPSARLGAATTTALAAPTTTTTAAGTTTTTAPSTTTTTATPATTTPVTTSPPRPARTTTPSPTGSGIEGTVRFGPVCPVERIPPDPACAPRPGAAVIRLVGTDGQLRATGEAGADGRFSIPVAPGDYAVTATASAPSPGRGCQADPAQVTVVAGSFTSVSVLCDTGIR